MPAIDFPAAPAVNDDYSFEGRTWRWNGTGWEVKEYPAALLAGFRNAIINGDFFIWQRGLSFSNPATGAYLADRWLHGFDGTGSTRTISIQSFTLGQTDVPGEPSYFFRYNVSVAGTGGTNTNIQQRIEGVRTFAGQQVTLSFYAKAASAITLPSISINQNFGTGGSPSATVNTNVATNIAIGTSWARYSYTVTLPSISGKTIGSNGDAFVNTPIVLPLNATYTFDIALVQLELGPVATPFESRPREVELALCQRYYAIVDTFLAGYTAAGVTNSYSLQLCTQMRATPTITAGATTNTNTTGAAVANLGTGHVRHNSLGAALGGFISSAVATLSAEL